MSKFMKTPLFLLFALVLQAQAIQFSSRTNTYTVSESETIDDELWLQTPNAEVNGLVKDDLFLHAANRMALGGEFERNIWGLGNNIALTGNARRNVRLMGMTIQIEGRIDGNVLMAGDTIKVAPDAAIGGDMEMVGSSIILEGNTQGDVSITAIRSVTISGTIGGNLDIVAPEIILQRDTRIGGDLTYTAPKELVPAKGVVAGKLERAFPRRAPAFSKERLYSRTLWFFAALLFGIPFISLFPVATAMATQTVRTAPFKCLWVGAVCTLALPAIGGVCILSGTGLPLGALILGGWGFMAYASRIVMGLVIGTLVLRKTALSAGQVLRSMALGLAIIYIATAIPSISPSVWIVVISMGTGALLLGLLQRRRMAIQLPAELKKLEDLKNQNINETPEDKP